MPGRASPCRRGSCPRGCPRRTRDRARPARPYSGNRDDTDALRCPDVRLSGIRVLSLQRHTHPVGSRVPRDRHHPPKHGKQDLLCQLRPTRNRNLVSTFNYCITLLYQEGQSFPSWREVSDTPRQLRPSRNRNLASPFTLLYHSALSSVFDPLTPCDATSAFHILHFAMRTSVFLSFSR